MRDAPSDLVGAVLAGGRSRRFGSDKSRATVGGRSLLDRSLDALAPSVGRRAVVLPARATDGPRGLGPGSDGRPAGSSFADSRDGPPGVVILRDSVGEAGPLEGLRVALEWARDEGAAGIVVLSCDVPLVDAGTVAGLVAAWRGRPPEAPHGVVPVAGGRDQTLVAVYSVEVLHVVARSLESDDRSLRGMLQALRVQRVPAARLVPAGSTVSPEERFLNVNTPEDRERAAALLDAGEEEPDGA